mmetsp:Transcript_17533/g.44466  ORF Transcript_17533/g.44466 Transcript_17533/m.44466 type:complete len:129 (+) Transcript_17533:92-478(+)
MADHRTKRNVAENTYQTSLTYKEKFPVGKVKTIISEVLESRLANQTYQSDQSSSWTREISDEVKNRIKQLKLNRYKVVVQTLIGEKRGQGVRFGTRSFWDPNTDFAASETFSNENLFAVVVAYGVWTY